LALAVFGAYDSYPKKELQPYLSKQRKKSVFKCRFANFSAKNVSICVGIKVSEAIAWEQIMYAVAGNRQDTEVMLVAYHCDRRLQRDLYVPYSTFFVVVQQATMRATASNQGHD